MGEKESRRLISGVYLATEYLLWIKNLSEIKRKN
jgi:hypothetical protein